MDSGPRSKNDLETLEDSNSFTDSLKAQWNLFWHGLVGEDEAEVAAEDPFLTGRLRSLTVDQIKQITRALSQDRRKINQHIEKINSEIENNSQTVENLKLVGGDPEEVLEKINKLTDAGQQLSLQLQKVDEQLRKFREREDALKLEIKD